MINSYKSSSLYRHVHYHYHIDHKNLSAHDLYNPLTNSYIDYEGNNLQLNGKDSWKSYINPEITKLYEQICQKDINNKFQHLEINDHSEKSKTKDISKDLLINIKATSRASLESLKDQITKHQEFILQHTNKSTYEQQTKSMIDLGQPSKRYSERKQQSGQTNYSRITPMNSIQQLSFKRADSRISYGGKQAECQITPIKKQTNNPQMDYEFQENKTRMSLVTRGSESDSKLMSNSKINMCQKHQNWVTNSQTIQERFDSEINPTDQQFSINQQYKSSTQINRNILQSNNVTGQITKQIIINNFDESYRYKLMREECDYLRNNIINHFNQDHGTKI